MDQCLTLAISAQNFCTSDVQITQTVNTHEYEKPELSTLHTPYFIPPITENGYLSLHSADTTRTCYSLLRSLLPTRYSVLRTVLRTYYVEYHTTDTYLFLPIAHPRSTTYSVRFFRPGVCLLACQPSSDHHLRILSGSCPPAPSSSALATC
jgi:hypothetical protein